MGVRLSTPQGERLHVNAPKGKLPSDVRAQIAERKTEILAFLRRQASSNRIAAPPIRLRANRDPAPLSFGQERLWFLEQMDPGGAVYNICRASRLLGTLDLYALQASLKELVNRHETLRTAFRLIEGQSAQVIYPRATTSIEAVDLNTLAPAKLRKEIRRRIKAEAERPFDLAAGQLLRATLIRRGDNDHVLVLTTHHSVSDAWSMGILTRELWTLYEALSKGRPSALQPLPVQYSDYAVWQREWLQGPVFEAQLSYWRERLKDLSVLDLPTDRPRRPRQSFRGARLAVELPEHLTRFVQELSNRFGVTPFMTLLAAFQVLLYRYTGQQDIAVGSPVANRRRPEVEGLVGFFVNSLVLRGDLSGDPSFRDLLLRTKNLCVDADANQDLPFEKVVQELQPERDQSRNPLFQVMFVLQNATRPFTGIPGLRIEPLDVPSTRSVFDLSLFLRERDGKYIGHIEYSTDLFNRDRIERMAGHFQVLLNAATSDPDQPIAKLPILTEAERHQILFEWNDTAAEYSKDKCIHHLLEEQVERTPEAIAVEFEDQQITYQELNRRANQLAHYLIGLGIGPEKLVGICIERSIEMVTGLLGILKAGGAYVPLDPVYPDARLQFMLEDAHICVLLTQQRFIEDRRSKIEDSNQPPSRDPVSSIFNPRLQVVQLDRDAPQIEQQSTENPNNSAHSANLAYVIYTSGSTGHPKAVAIEHRNTVNLLYWAKSVYKPADLAGVLASTSICFDLSVFELFVPLSSGGKIILVENALSLRKRTGSGITLINTVPSVMAQVLVLGRLPESVQVVNLAGEPLKSDLVKRLYGQAGVQRVYDLYGPSETTTYSTFTLRQPNGLETIGHPVGNTQMYILDNFLGPVPVGIVGEIFIGGSGVARGYLNRSDLTAEKFIADPFREGQPSQLYRTGDRGRYLPDGNIEYLGRLDHQVKIRGYRIEPGEIEAILTKHPAVKECIVVTCEQQSRSANELLAYVVPSKQSVISGNELRRYVKEALPEYMIPSSFVVLETLPSLANGKVDRNSLPPPDGTRFSVGRQFVPPRSEIEELIAQIWREVLGIEKVGIYDNFFELGGHSLMAAQIVAQLQEAFNKDVPVGVVFNAPTISEFAQELEKILGYGHAPELPPIVSVPRDKPLPLSLNQEHLWRLNQMMPGTHFFNMPYVYRLDGDLNIDALRKALRKIITRHESLRTVFTEVNGEPRQVIRRSVRVNIRISDMRKIAPEHRSRRAAKLVMSERSIPFDLAAGPLVRFKLLQLTDTSSLLLVTMHHIISDQWSMQVFRSELEVLYEAFFKGRLSPLAELEVQFADFAVWERSALSRGLLQRQLAYWTDQLTRLSQPLTWHGIKSKKPSKFQRSREPIEIDENGLSHLRGIAQREAVTVFMVVVTALGVFLRLKTNTTEIRIGTLVANRRRETEKTIGHFLNTVVLCLSIEPYMTCRQLLRQVRQTTLSAFRSQDLPYERLSQVLKEGEHAQPASPPPVLLSYQTARFVAAEQPYLQIVPLTWQLPASESEMTPTTFDLIITLRETSKRLAGNINHWSGIPRASLSPLNAFLNSTLRQMGDMIETRISTLMA